MTAANSRACYYGHRTTQPSHSPSGTICAPLAYRHSPQAPQRVALTSLHSVQNLHCQPTDCVFLDWTSADNLLAAAVCDGTRRPKGRALLHAWHSRASGMLARVHCGHAQPPGSCCLCCCLAICRDDVLIA